MEFTEIRALVEDDLKRVNETILKELHSKVPLIESVGEHIVKSGGKRLRPMLVLLAAKACQYLGNHHISLAAIIEFIHTATLLHDDVVDASLLRRGQETANAVWGNSTSVLVGDFVYSRSFQMMVGIENMQVMRILADATNQIAEGEVLQLLFRHNPDTTESDYRNIIHYKTATLFEAALKLAAEIGKCDRQTLYAMAEYGLRLGMAFQMIDDAMDYDADAAAIGKNIGDDLAEGKTTLPLIYALQHADPTQIESIRAAIKHGDLEKLSLIQQAIASTKAIAYTYDTAKKESLFAKKALSVLPPSIYRDALMSLADFAVNRRY
jgi:octaprenyl-diphosphate synthase